MSGTNWTCPYCGRHTTITPHNYCQSSGSLETFDKGIDGSLKFVLKYIVCPNPDCHKYTLRIDIGEWLKGQDGYGRPAFIDGKEILSSMLIPKGNARPLPEYIPDELVEDYREACLILEDSPKASAALSRRCLQGIIRRFFGISKPKLYDEIQALREHLSTDLWEAVDAIRDVGNVGAHSERDVNVIVEVTPEAARALIELIELLFDETYIKQHDQQERIRKAKEAASSLRADSNEDPPD